MSLKYLNERIQRCSRDMDRQRGCAQLLLNQQKNDVVQLLQGLPLPTALGLALISGFLAQRILPSPKASHLFRLYLSWRSL